VQRERTRSEGFSLINPEPLTHGTARHKPSIKSRSGFKGSAGINGGVASANSVEFDPLLPLQDQFCCASQQRSRRNPVV